MDPRGLSSRTNDQAIARIEVLLAQIKDPASQLRQAVATITPFVTENSDLVLPASENEARRVIYPREGEQLPPLCLHDLSVWYNCLTRSDRVGRLFPLDVTRTWAPGDPLWTIPKNAQKYHRQIVLFKKRSLKKVHIAGLNEEDEDDDDHEEDDDDDDLERSDVEPVDVYRNGDDLNLEDDIDVTGDDIVDINGVFYLRRAGDDDGNEVDDDGNEVPGP